ncbi:glycosyltransferase family 34 protein [[Candida] arabinofermentans NRRL YB-2248]|uniref:Glycosyltransferase family 34 protein n=1 Tax=[Candida] arabinofermentans NRRL YB-2248 TaxID=983967 RepID=A0A1E4T5L7_9ASCO|nr:glycosyltransferase family 34 protein [[Candida] arabinofermentans NRRL YB-2248]
MTSRIKPTVEELKRSDSLYSKSLKPSPTSKQRYSKYFTPSFYVSLLSRHKKALIALFSLVILSVYTSAPFIPHYHFKEPNVVIILAANEGGGVQRWKTPQEWSVERSSISNKKDYAKRHGYTLAIKDTTLKRRYSHEWREGWEKADILKQTMRQYPNAEWFWWLDLHTFIMEPQISLEKFLFEDLEKKVYRTLDHLNPLGLPVDSSYVDIENSPIDLILAQDCGGFNLGSFLIRRSEWSEILMDVWWDPAMYEQMHMTWEHKEQDCLENLYKNQPWIRERVGFVPLRAINSFPPGACSDQKDDPRYFYDSKDRDFVVNMAGCNFGDRSCWDEYEYYRNLQKSLNKRWYKFW